jgi:hypothetical protein
MIALSPDGQSQARLQHHDLSTYELLVGYVLSVGGPTVVRERE